ncbi:DUF2306 domain-containing protein [Siphonobacter sp. SORGH_AS_1065]|uniref:DUF2306 domain-containing protein n=1 Tax=Siphonobacter sp. SORGH_AS_1065 TaxID=3041795 RepID=UPI00277EA7A3|nr:DUF2306 domain-containing protein [Siphonobacter sp. SORGH_AS_1065]MDQ1088366.1 putative membrane protein [Siphonobacter sp. SORGH_AS_1065]
MTKKALWILFATMAILIGLYPTLYLFLDKKFGLLSTKDNGLFKNIFWSLSFYIHIISGGLALLIGWTQFSKKIRARNLTLHRQIGKIYVISALISALTSLYIAIYSTGGLFTSLGFICLGFIWFYTTLTAFIQIKKGMIANHEKMMLYSYALCFAAVTLRIWLPLLVILFNDFISAYKIVAWLCWIPNLLIAFLIIKRIEKRETIS